MLFLKNLLGFFQYQKFPFKFVYNNAYWMVDLGDHVFPIKKYRYVYEKLLVQGVKKDNFVYSMPAEDRDICLIHSKKYLQKIRSGKFSSSELATLEIPFSTEGLNFFCLNAGGTIQAAELALQDGFSVHIGGGFHHAFPTHGEGFCVLNDVAIALEKLIKDSRIRKAMVVDCDVHQGNGTAEIFNGKEYAFTFSIHQMDLYPAHKPPSSLDIGLWAGDGDEKYLNQLHTCFPRIYEEFQPDLVFYLAGADPYKNDRLGGLNLSIDGLAERDSNAARRPGRL